MSLKNNNIDIEKDNNPNKIPDGIVIAEDSGFASITGSITLDDRMNEVETLICDDIKFSEAPIENPIVLKKKKNAESKTETKRLAEEEYNNEKKEQTYKRLMHLLNRSKFYANIIVEKVNNTDKISKPRVGRKRKVKKVQEKSENSIIPIKRSKRIGAANEKYNTKEFISDDVQKKIRRKMNLSLEEIEDELNADSDNEKPDTSTTGEFVKPKYFDGDLFDYQVEGLQWMKVLYENGLNGILADEMGLGKTIQVIALICYLIEKKQNGPYLIIVPLSTLPNWLAEFKRFAPTIPVIVLYGSKSERFEIAKKINVKVSAGSDGFKTKPVILTTYEITIRDFSLRAFNWRYIVIDEAQRIKNYKCTLCNRLRHLKSISRIILTGTPLQNNLAELWSLLNFLLPDIFSDLDIFESWFDLEELQNVEGTKRFLKQEQEKKVMSSLREILKPFMLRREKADVNLNIPPKKEIIVYAPVTELQRDLYTATLNCDYDIMTKVDSESLIIDDENGVRPKRKCLSRHKYSATYSNPYKIFESRSNSVNQSSSTSSFKYDNDFYDYKAPLYQEKFKIQKDQSYNEMKVLEMWKQYGNVNDRNRDFYIRLTMTSPMAMYKKIINHPYLVHCPLDDAGLPQINEDIVKVSGKLMVLDALLKKLYARGHKVLLFSTMTMILDVVGDYLMLRPWKYFRLDGTTKIEDRRKEIATFNNDPDIFLYLISTRAGGVGLNLAAADTVIMYDSDWNPQADIQAMARCHRIGQTRPVMIYRLCTKGTIDERIIQRAEAKRKLEKMVISKDISLNLNHPDTILELMRLLESSDNVVVTSEHKVFTEAELDKLLDRSDLSMPESSNISLNKKKKENS